MPTPNPNQLIVEGHDDLFAVVALMKSHIGWPEDRGLAPVQIEIGKSAREILKASYLTTILKTPGLRNIGIVLDADSVPKGRYDSIRSICSQFFTALPVELPAGGLVISENGQRFGVWIMPDNHSDGCLETFLRNLVPDQSEDLWSLATGSVQTARSLGAPWRTPHLPKANLYTWLAWQDPPGQNPGRALTQRILNVSSPSAVPFVKWFRRLYEIPES